MPRPTGPIDDFDTALIDYDCYVDQTGGGCTALRHDVGDDAWFWITADEDLAAPTTLDEPVLVGFYWNEGQDWRTFPFPTLRAAYQWLGAHLDGVERISEVTG